jgi:hypothetical protein
VRGWIEGVDSEDSNIRVAGTNGDGEWVVGDEGESESIDVEAAGAFCVNRRDKGKKFGLGEHNGLPERKIDGNAPGFKA